MSEKKNESLPIPNWYKCNYWEGTHFTAGEVYPSYREGMLIANDGMPRIFNSQFSDFEKINLDPLVLFIKSQ